MIALTFASYMTIKYPEIRPYRTPQTNVKVM